MMIVTFWKMVKELLRNVRDGWDDIGFRAISFAALSLLASGTLFYWVVEDWSVVDAFYFSVTTLTTVGFGDLTPTKDYSKIFTVFYIFVGIGVIASLITNLAARSATRASELHALRVTKANGNVGSDEDVRS